jgi:hypothetical protein
MAGVGRQSRVNETDMQSEGKDKPDGRRDGEENSTLRSLMPLRSESVTMTPFLVPASACEAVLCQAALLPLGNL